MIKISGVNLRSVRSAEQKMQTGLASRSLSDAFQNFQNTVCPSSALFVGVKDCIHAELINVLKNFKAWILQSAL